MIGRAILAFALVWLAMPHEPDLGLGRPGYASLLSTSAATRCRVPRDGTCDGEVFHALLGSVGSLIQARSALLEGIERVRADFAANRRGRDRAPS